MFIRFQFIMLMITTLILSGCGSSLSEPATIPITGYTIQDDHGQVLRFKQKPQRIVSMSIAADEMLMALVEPARMVALSRLVDDGGISNITEQAKQVPGRVESSAEAIIGLQPDLVIVPSWKALELIQILRDAGIAVYVYQAPHSITEIKQIILRLADLVGEPDRGRMVVDEMEHELAKVREKVQAIPAAEQQTVIRLTLLGGSSGAGSTFDHLCREAGVKNGAAVAGLGANGSLSKEQILKVNPDVLILPLWNYSAETNMDQFKKDVQADPALQPVAAIRNRRLIQIPERHVYCSSQYVVRGVRAVAEAAYPQYFGQ